MDPIFHLSKISGSIRPIHLQTEQQFPDILKEIFQKANRKKTSSLKRQWKKQDLSKEKKRLIEEFKGILDFIPFFVEKLASNMDSKKEKKVLQDKINHLVLEKTPLEFLNIKEKIVGVKDTLISILKDLPPHEFDDLKDFFSWPISLKGIMELTQLEKEMIHLRQSDMQLTEISRKVLNLNEPERALAIANFIKTEILKLMIYKNVIRFYIDNGEINSALQTIMSVSDKEAQIQLIKSLALQLN